MKQGLKELTENTAVSLGMVVALGSVLFWLAGFVETSTANTKEIAYIKDKQEKYNSDLQGIKESLADIKGQLRSRR